MAGTRPDPSDDAFAEAAKKQVAADDHLELIHDPSDGRIVGARTKQKYLPTIEKPVALVPDGRGPA